MFRYLVFAYYRNYPIGGMRDCVEKTNSVEEVIKTWESEKHYDYIEVYDCHTGEKIVDLDVFKQEHNTSLRT